MRAGRSADVVPLMSPHRFGGPWTVKKLEVLKAYPGWISEPVEWHDRPLADPNAWPKFRQQRPHGYTLSLILSFSSWKRP